ncbi:amino acid ABC transporter substrate-binding protein [Devosia aquimaris]|uniref:amino acid ABC transporter substrate-binding protein n=1 Tax=Devosia aquimaris TaxID=2866214 RepID=UPI001CD11E51|nr:amino acid ABC transporter substrate-binding protein [Devosia sp. CJK-A8-3]
MKNALPALALLFGCLAGPAVAEAHSLSPTLDKIRQSGEIAIGYRESEPPFAYTDTDGSIIGFSIDLCQRVVDKVRESLGRPDITVRYVPATPATRFILVKSGMIDLECAATTNNAERREMVGFSYPHFMTASRFVSRRADNIETLEDLAGRSVASASGTVNIDQINAVNRERRLNIAVIPTKTNDEAFDLVAHGRAAAFVMDDILLAAKIAASPDPDDYVLSTVTLSAPEPYGLLLRHGDAPFKTLVNDTLAEIYTSGQIEQLYAKWFTSPIPPNGINLNLPLSPQLAEAFSHPVEYLE